MKDLWVCSCHWQITTGKVDYIIKELPTFYVQAGTKDEANRIASRIVDQEPEKRPTRHYMHIHVERI